jgi:hypothetical protein
LAVGYSEFHLVWHGRWNDWNIAYIQVDISFLNRRTSRVIIGAFHLIF